MKFLHSKNIVHRFFIVIWLFRLLLAGTACGAETMTVDFDAAPTSGKAPLTVQFLDQSGGSIDERLWDFDFDGQPDSRELNPVYTFTRPGNYTINLIVIGVEGALTRTKTDFIVVDGQPQEAPASNFENIGGADRIVDDRLLQDSITLEDMSDVVGESDFQPDIQPTERTLTGAVVPAINARDGAAPAEPVNENKGQKEKVRKVKLRWDANLEANVSGYNLYYNADSSGPPYNGTGADQGDSPITVDREELEDKNKPKFEITGLSSDRDYYFALTAFDNQSPPNESGFSNEASTVDVDGPESGGSGGGCFIQAFLLMDF